MTSLRAPGLMTAALIVLTASSCTPGSPSPSESATVSQPVSFTPSYSPPADAACVEFEAPLAIGTQFGAPSGLAPGDDAFTENDVLVVVDTFLYSGGTGSAFNWAEVQAAPATFGSGQVVFLNNINFGFHYRDIGFAPARVEFDFRDQGGNENFAINGEPTPVYSDQLSAVTGPYGGATVTVTMDATGELGHAVLIGDIDKFLVGGQEFSLDHVCAFASP